MSDSTDLVDRFRHGSSVLAAALEGVSEAESNFSPAPGKWTIREIMRHLFDTEVVAAMRLRQMIAENKPTLAVFDQDVWAKEFGYGKYDPFESLAQFRNLRESNAALIAGLTPQGLDREGIHAERGILTVRDWVERFTAHVDSHARQIKKIREAWAAGRSPKSDPAHA
jgi:hypothetical protein